MTVRIKVKHLLLFVLLPLSLLGIIGVMLPSFTAVNSKENSLSASASEHARAKLLNSLDAVTGSKRMDLIRTAVIEPGNATPLYHFNVYIGASGSQWTRDNNEEPPSPLLPGDKIRLLREYILNGPTDSYMISAIKQLLYEYDAIGTADKGEEVLAAAVERVSSSSSMAWQITLLRAERALNTGSFAAASALLKQADSPAHYNEAALDARSDWLGARLLFEEGKSTEALNLVNLALEKYRGDLNEMNKKLDGTEEQLIALQSALKSAQELGVHSPASLSGTLMRSDGTPIARAGVFLRAESEVYHSVMYDSEPYQIVTDAQGHFQFSGIIPGFYQLQLGLSFEQIDGWTWPVQYEDWIEIKAGDTLTNNIVLQPLLELKLPVNSQVITGPSVHFKWEPVKDAAYYSLSGTVWADAGNSFSSIIREHVPGNEVSIPTEELYDSGGFSYGSSGEDWQSIDPSSLLGFADPNSRFSWSVEAYDASGQVITRSNGYRLNEDTLGNLPFFYLKSRTLTAADRLVADKKLEEALAAYRQDYAADPQDTHALKMLTHILTAKASFIKDKQAEEAAIPLLRRLVELRPNENYAFSLAQHYYNQSDWENYNKYYHRSLELRPEEANSYMQSINASALMVQGKLTEARQQFALALADDSSHRFIGRYLAAELAAGQPLSSALELAKRYPEHGYGVSGDHWPLMIMRLQAERTGQPEAFDRQLKEKLELYMKRQDRALRQWTEQGEPSALKEFMKSVLEVG
ncbi:carboxypeptidase-like regulatory domain-containing protein [Paenibacillus sp. HW567]|uniref:carboxypeptidase-like regulatory domain-containing protein n=1 Tax=Paenibacillus sp. HW567 TaxID=1034769 RepID=UPI000361C6CC|nr:carboxypeptidase-like regulatory domain-containing protein [Paenibacillus sp. HW567]